MADKMTICNCGKSVRTAYYQKHIKTSIHDKRIKRKQEKRFQIYLGNILIHFD